MLALCRSGRMPRPTAAPRVWPSRHPLSVRPPPGSRALDRALGLVPGPDPHDGYRLVTDAMQDSLSALTRKRRFPVIG